MDQVSSVFSMAVILGVFLLLPAVAVVFAALSARRLGRAALIVGAALSLAGMTLMALVAWSTHEDVHYDDFGSLMWMLVGIVGAEILLIGLAPRVPWLLRLLARGAGRLPVPVRLAARHLAGSGARSAGVAAAMAGTAFAVSAMVIVAATNAQGASAYQPVGHPGTLAVTAFLADDEPRVRAAIHETSPEATILAYHDVRAGWIEGEGRDVLDSTLWIGDERLLRHLTTDRALPYRAGSVVVLDDQPLVRESLELRYRLRGTGPGNDSLSSVVPAVSARPAQPGRIGIFVPAEVVRGLGLTPEPAGLLVESRPVTMAQQDRLDDRLDGLAVTRVERGFQPSSGGPWILAPALCALAGVLVAASGRPRGLRVLLRLAGGSSVRARGLLACRAALASVCGLVPGILAGCVIGPLLVWPFTTESGWEDYVRVAYDVPWSAIAMLGIALPGAAALLRAAVFRVPAPRSSPDV